MCCISTNVCAHIHSGNYIFISLMEQSFSIPDKVNTVFLCAYCFLGMPEQKQWTAYDGGALR